MSTNGAWDSGNSDFTLSNGDRTGTATGAFQYTESTDGHSTGKYYLELTTTTVKSGDLLLVYDQGVGTAEGIAYSNNGHWENSASGSPSGTIQTFTSGTVTCIAVDTDAGKVWFRKGAGSWNNSGTANPATGVGGLSYTVAGAGPIFVEYDSGASGSVVTINTGTVAFTQTAPSGFGNWYSVAGPTAYSLTAAAGSYALTGTAATLKRGRVVAAAAGSYAVTGTAATLRKGLKVTAASGSYAISGAAASFARTWRAIAGSGSYSISGQAATLRAARVVAAASGSYALNGSSAQLRATRILTSGAGSYTLTGTAVTLTAIHTATIAADPGTYALTGQAASLLRSFRLAGDAGSYEITGSDAGLVPGGTVEAPASVTTAGGYRPAGTQYRAKTISRELREKERAARKAARKLRTRVVAALEAEPWFANPEAASAALAYVKTEIAETVTPQFLEDGMSSRIFDAALAHLIAEATIRAEIEADDDFLLLAA